MSQYYSQQPGTATKQGTGFIGWLRNLSGMSVLVGAGLGIIVGLFLGWVVWPVQYTDAWPGDLKPEAKAQYLAAVAQVYSYYPDSRAAETASTRLFDLNENIGDEIAAAQTFFQENQVRDSSVYITMLSELAAGLDASTAAPFLGDNAPAEAAAEEAAASPVATEGGTSWWTWLLSLLVVVGLVGGGVYIISRIARNQRSPAPAVQPAYAGAQPVAAGSGRASGAYGIPPADDYRFDQEPDETIVYTPGTAVVEGEIYDDDTFFDDASAASYSQADQREAERVAPPSARSQAAAAVAYEAAVGYDEDEMEDELDVEESPRTQSPGVLGTYELHYHAGVPEFEQSHNIMDPATGRYIGECGMGVNMKNGILQDVPENVIALDVWLFDQKRDKSLGNQTRVLLSEYAIDHGLEQVFVRERPDGPSPVVAQPGVSFQLKGEAIVVDCEILEADYAESGRETGIFQNLRANMTVRSRA